MFYTDVKPRMPLAEYDHTLLWASALLLGLGLVMVYSASIAIAEGSRATGNQPVYYLSRHALFAAAGIVRQRSCSRSRCGCGSRLRLISFCSVSGCSFWFSFPAWGGR